MVLHLNKLEFQSTKDALYQVWLKFGPVILEKRLLKVVNVILLCCNYLPLEKCVTLHLNKLELLSPKDAFAKFGCIVPMVLGDRQTDNRQSEKHT